MRRHGNLWSQLVSFQHLLRASQKAKRGKRFRPDVASFEFRLEPELWRLQDELRTETYRPGRYRSFYINEPKQRLISAAPYQDRVVHHALAGILEPIFDPTFIHDSYACRTGKGTHAAVDRCQQFARRYRYVLRTDIRKFFPSMDHEILKKQIRSGAASTRPGRVENLRGAGWG
jgi:RNA-directed DNA polymerase